MYTPDPKDPMNTDSNSTKPIEELQDSLKAEISRNVKTEILNLEPDEEAAGTLCSSPYSRCRVYLQIQDHWVFKWEFGQH